MCAVMRLNGDVNQRVIPGDKLFVVIDSLLSIGHDRNHSGI